jgi:hypothetical protein
MRKGPFVPKQFTATQWSKQYANAEFGSRLLRFIDSGFKQMFGHEEAVLAVVEYVWTHCPLQPGDFLGGECFVEASDLVRFIEHLLRWPCYADPEFTFSDVERALP